MYNTCNKIKIYIVRNLFVVNIIHGKYLQSNKDVNYLQRLKKQQQKLITFQVATSKLFK